MPRSQTSGQGTMALDVRLHPLADDDLNRIYDFIAADNPARAIAFLRELEALSFSLGDHPEKGRLRPDLGADIRSFSMRRRVVICYRVDANAVEILRFVYAGRLLDPLDFPKL
ncbi:type II toxin-antitoxin system RelE/ParE family toxin [Rhizobium sp. CG5]|nr:type II toxin-antitoxin system RelE/ParE family toxin [Rhizobium sp. CG5]